LRKRNYLNNRDILKEIHNSKNKFNSYTHLSYHRYDIILHSVNEIDNETVEAAKKNKAKRLSLADYESRRTAGEKIKQAECEVDLQSITNEELIFRVMDFNHIPDQPGRKKNPKTIADTKVKLNFPPFKHYKFENGEITCVGKSHWKGDLETGHFDREHGKATDNLALMWLKLVDRYATRGNVRGYTYNDEMKGQAILQLAQIGLQFDESKSDNPFAYYTAAVTNSFVRVINIEKRNQNVRDDILEMNDLNPSYTRTNNEEWNVSVKRYGDPDSKFEYKK
jgi:hypothetical protein